MEYKFPYGARIKIIDHRQYHGYTGTILRRGVWNGRTGYSIEIDKVYRHLIKDSIYLAYEHEIELDNIPEGAAL